MPVDAPGRVAVGGQLRGNRHLGGVDGLREATDDLHGSGERGLHSAATRVRPQALLPLARAAPAQTEARGPRCPQCLA
eukprot:4435741-Alexandrium_andersonii.AAC.1